MNYIKKLDTLTKIQILLIIGSVVALLTPVISSYYFMTNNYEVIADFVQQDITDEQLSEYSEYNKKITDDNFYTEDPFDRYVDVETNEPKTVGVLHLPQIKEQLAIYDVTNDLTLSKGLGLLEGTHYPTGGLNHTTVVTGHRGTSDATLFQNIDKLDIGDVFWVDNGIEELYYEVYDTEIVRPYETDKLRIVPNQDTFILLSCETIDIKKGLNTHRILVYAKRTEEPVKEELQEEPKVDNLLKFKVMGGIALVLLVLGGIIIIKEMRRRG